MIRSIRLSARLKESMIWVEKRRLQRLGEIGFPALLQRPIYRLQPTGSCLNGCVSSRIDFLGPGRT